MFSVLSEDEEVGIHIPGPRRQVVVDAVGPGLPLDVAKPGEHVVPGELLGEGLLLKAREASVGVGAVGLDVEVTLVGLAVLVSLDRVGRVPALGLGLGALAQD